MGTKIKVTVNDVLRIVREEQKREKFDAPELASYFKGATPVLTVRRASLEDHIQARKLAAAPMNALEQIIQAVKLGESIDLELIESVLHDAETHPKTDFELKIFKRCVYPEFTLQEVEEISKVFPFLVNRAVKFALGLKGE